jgi:hypothetical protein
MLAHQNNIYPTNSQFRCISDFFVKDYGVAHVDIHSQTNNYTDPYKDKYIQLLEAEVARLKKLEEK